MLVRLLLPAICLLPGCAALPLAAVGSALGLAGAVAGTGADVYGAGKLDSAEPHDLEATRAAVVAAGADLGLAFRAERAGEPAHVLRFADARGATIDVTLDPRAPTLTLVRINVGLFGSEPVARLVLQRLRARLGDPAATAGDL